MEDQMSAFSNDISSLVAARRLMIAAQEFQDEREGKKVKRKDAQERMEEDQVLLSGQAPETEKIGEKPAASAPVPGIDINLKELSAKLQQLQAQPAQQQAGVAAQQLTIEAQIKEEIAIQVKYTQLGKVDGLVVHNPNQAETDRYAFEFENAYSLKIVDKWSGKHTRVWGDPHVDTSDEEGDANGEFSDLKGSNLHTTMMLQDGTRVTFTALDNGIIEKVDIYKGQQHLSGVGAGAKDFTAENALFAKSVDSNTSSSAVPMGDTVYAGGDGNDWYDRIGQLVWGKTTSAPVLSKPSAILEMSYRRTLTQQISINSIGLKA
jgi:hypothetical protein